LKGCDLDSFPSFLQYACDQSFDKWCTGGGPVMLWRSTGGPIQVISSPWLSEPSPLLPRYFQEVRHPHRNLAAVDKKFLKFDKNTRMRPGGERINTCPPPRGQPLPNRRLVAAMIFAIRKPRRSIVGLELDAQSGRTAGLGSMCR